MSKRIILDNGDGSIAVIIPASEALNKMTIEEIAVKDSKGKPYRITDTVNLPNDRYFRNAWTDNVPGEQVDVDLDKARVIHMNILRKERDRKLEALDIDFMRAIEMGDTVAQSQIAAKKQALRDMPANNPMTDITSPDQIKAYISTEFGD